MLRTLETYVNRFQKNYLAVKAQFFSDTSIFPYLGAYLLTAANADPEPLRDCKQMLCSLSDRFDGFAEQSAPLLCAGAIISGQPEKFLFSVASAYRVLKDSFLPSPHLIPAAYLLARFCPEPTDYDNHARQAARLHEKIGQAHPFLTGYEDIPVCVLYTLQPEPDAVFDAIEDCAVLLKPLSGKRNILQALSHTAALYPLPKQACANIVSVFGQLRTAGVSLGSGTPVTALGALGNCTTPPEITAAAVTESSAVLSKMAGFRLLELGGKDRAMLCCLLSALVCCDYSADAPQPPLIAALLSILAGNLSDDVLTRP